MRNTEGISIFNYVVNLVIVHIVYLLAFAIVIVSIFLVLKIVLLILKRELVSYLK